MIRTFIAIEIPEQVITQIARAQSELRPLPGSRIAWVKPLGVHLTLKFLGDVPESDIERISSIVGNAAAKTPPFELKTGSPGGFPNIRKPRILWWGIEESEPLAEAQMSIDRGLGEIGFPVEKKSFHPHLTIGRVKHLDRDSDIPARFGSFEFKTVTWQVREIRVMSSILKPAGAEYSVLAGVNLQQHRDLLFPGGTK